MNVKSETWLRHFVNVYGRLDVSAFILTYKTSGTPSGRTAEYFVAFNNVLRRLRMSCRDPQTLLSIFHSSVTQCRRLNQFRVKSPEFPIRLSKEKPEWQNNRVFRVRKSKSSKYFHRLSLKIFLIFKVFRSIFLDDFLFVFNDSLSKNLFALKGFS